MYVVAVFQMELDVTKMQHFHYAYLMVILN